MPNVSTIVTWEIKGFLFALFGIVAVKLLTGEINTTYLFYGRKNDTGNRSLGQTGESTEGSDKTHLTSVRSESSFWFSH